MENLNMRVAVSQFATSSNSQENLATCIRMINETAVCEPSVIVLPEFCNTLFCNTNTSNTNFYKTNMLSTESDKANAKDNACYADHNQAWDEALSLDGDFLKAIAEQAKKHGCYIVINVTLRRDETRDFSKNAQEDSIKSNISVTTCVFSPLGKLINQTDKQTLVGYEKHFFTSTNEVPEVVTTSFGKLGLLMGSDSMSFEKSRGLALLGAKLLCNSINSFALDQSRLHDPARACENKVFLATANKIGSLISQNVIPLDDFESNDIGVDIGIGQSQIISPDGKVLAKIAYNEEGFVYADIGVLGVEGDAETETETGVGLNNKYRPDGTAVIKQRRPTLYQKLIGAIKIEPLHDNSTVPTTANVAIFATYTSNEKAIEDVCHYIENNLSDIIQLPELFFVSDKTITNNPEQLAEISRLSAQVIDQVSSVLRPFQYLCTSLVIEGIHQAVLISENGLLATQQQLHFCKRYQWTTLGDELAIIKLPLEQGIINVAMLTADDANISEIVKIVAMNSTHVLLVPFDIQEACEVEYSLVSQAAENRMCIVAASREKSLSNQSTTYLINDLPNHLSNDKVSKNIFGKNKVKAQKSTGLIANLTADTALLPQWKSRKFTGYINQPLVKLQYGKITKAVVHPIAACTKRST